jgi:hypothetical protein
MFADVIREARNEYEIYFLLTSYVEAVRFGDQLNLVPEPVKKLPLASSDHVRAQYQQLVELDQTAKKRNDNSCTLIKEALPIFSAALGRLELLTVANRQPLPERRKRERRQHAPEGSRKPHVAGGQGERRVEPNEDYGQPARM